MAFFALAEGALAVPAGVSGGLGYMMGEARSLRCSVLRFSSALRRRQVDLLLLAAAAPSARAALVQVAAQPRINAAGGGQGVRRGQRVVWRAAVLWGGQPVEAESIVAAWEQSCVQRLL